MLFCCKIDETPDSPVCIGGYSALPLAKLLSLGIMQASLPFALAESQFCLWSLSCMFSFIVWLYLVQVLINVCPRISDIGSGLLNSYNAKDHFCIITIYSLLIVLTFAPLLLVGLVFAGILLLGISLTIVILCSKPAFSNISAVK